MGMYVYLQPKGGFNDILCRILYTLTYCIKYKRKLLIDGLSTVYKINLSDYLSFEDNNIICDMDKIKRICKNVKSIHPIELKNEINDIINHKIQFTYGTSSSFKLNDIFLKLPNKNLTEQLIIVSYCGGGNGYKLFQKIKFKQNIKDICNQRYELLQKPYLSIQVRNTDIKCNYKKIYDDNIDLIKSYDNIYLATDDINVLNYYKELIPNINNFTTYPNDICKNLHCSNIDPNTKFFDLLSDIYIISRSDKLISNSNGGFIELVYSCKNDINNIIKQFN